MHNILLVTLHLLHFPAWLNRCLISVSPFVQTGCNREKWAAGWERCPPQRNFRASRWVENADFRQSSRLGAWHCWIEPLCSKFRKCSILIPAGYATTHRCKHYIPYAAATGTISSDRAVICHTATTGTEALPRSCICRSLRDIRRPGGSQPCGTTTGKVPDTIGLMASNLILWPSKNGRWAMQ